MLKSSAADGTSYFCNCAGPYVSADEVWAVKEKCAATIQRFTRGWLARKRCTTPLPADCTDLGFAVAPMQSAWSTHSFGCTILHVLMMLPYSSLYGTMALPQHAHACGMHAPYSEQRL